MAMASGLGVMCEKSLETVLQDDAGLDSFAQRRPEIAFRIRVFEIGQPSP
jgi:hypothetical protein